MKTAVVLFVKDENIYIKEWMAHYTKLGFNHFFIIDNGSETPIISDFTQITKSEWSSFNDKTQVTFTNITFIKWNMDNAVGSQTRAYMFVKDIARDFDYLLFVDTDEFLVIKSHNTIQEYLTHIKDKYGKVDGIGIYWRIYGSNKPYFENRMNIDDYVLYKEDNHIKSIVNPLKISRFQDPHKPNLFNSKYIDENGNDIIAPIGKHTSNNIYIKHIWTRSINEFKEKIKRGSGDKVVRNWSMDDFYNCNDNCLLKD